MNVLQLEGESAQLRQVAKAFAAGEVSKEDYRHIRAAIIDAFLIDNSTVSYNPEALQPVRASGGAAVSVARYGYNYDEVGWSLLAIVGAGAMLLIVAMLAIVLA